MTKGSEVRQFNNSNQTPTGFFVELDQLNLKLISKRKEPKCAETILKLNKLYSSKSKDFRKVSYSKQTLFMGPSCV